MHAADQGLVCQPAAHAAQTVHGPLTHRSMLYTGPAADPGPAGRAVGPAHARHAGAARPVQQPAVGEGGWGCRECGACVGAPLAPSHGSWRCCTDRGGCWGCCALGVHGWCAAASAARLVHGGLLLVTATCKRPLQLSTLLLYYSASLADRQHLHRHGQHGGGCGHTVARQASRLGPPGLRRRLRARLVGGGLAWHVFRLPGSIQRCRDVQGPGHRCAAHAPATARSSSIAQPAMPRPRRWKNFVFGKTFVERRSLWTMYRCAVVGWQHWWFRSWFFMVSGHPWRPQYSACPLQRMNACSQCPAPQHLLPRVGLPHPGVSLHGRHAVGLGRHQGVWTTGAVPLSCRAVYAAPVETAACVVMLWGWDATQYSVWERRRHARPGHANRADVQPSHALLLCCPSQRGSYYALCSVALDHAFLSLLEQVAGAWTQRAVCELWLRLWGARLGSVPRVFGRSWLVRLAPLPSLLRRLQSNDVHILLCAVSAILPPPGPHLAPTRRQGPARARAALLAALRPRHHRLAGGQRGALPLPGGTGGEWLRRIASMQCQSLGKGTAVPLPVWRDGNHIRVPTSVALPLVTSSSPASSSSSCSTTCAPATRAWWWSMRWVPFAGDGGNPCAMWLLPGMAAVRLPDAERDLLGGRWLASL